jgi:hypothetical protein
MNSIKRNTFQKPILTGIVLMLIAMGFRLIDIYDRPNCRVNGRLVCLAPHKFLIVFL